MSDTNALTNDSDDIYNSHSSEERMDTGSESILSTQDTPNSVLSSDFDDKEQNDVKNNLVLRLQNPINKEIDDERLRSDDANHLSDSLNSSIWELRLNDTMDDSPYNRPHYLDIGQPRLSSTLMSTTDHPLMGISSPEYTEPKAKRRNEDESLSSIEDEKCLELYNRGPQRNTSKNNLYFSDHTNTSTANENKTVQYDDCINSHINGHVEDKGKPYSNKRIISGNMEWCDSPLMQSVPQFDLPIEMSSNICNNQNGDVSPDTLSWSTQENDHSTYQASVDPYSGNVALKHKPRVQQVLPQRRKILAILSEDADGLESDNDSVCSLQFEENDEQNKMPVPNDDDYDVNCSGGCNHVHSSKRDEHCKDKSTYSRCVYANKVNDVSPRPPSSSSQRRKIVALVANDADDSVDSTSICSLDIDQKDEVIDEEIHRRNIAGESPKGNDMCQRGNSFREKDSDSGSGSASGSSPIPEYSLAEEVREERGWVRVRVPEGGERSCDMRVIEPYKRALSHGGYDTLGGGAAIIVLSACHLPDTQRRDYRYVMDNLFLYVIWTLDRLVTDEYVLVYLHGSSNKRRLPSFKWIQQCYRLIDRRLRKSLKHLYLVHPTIWLKTIVFMSRPFISSKFFKKISYVTCVKQLMEMLPVEPNAIPQTIHDYEASNQL